MRDFRQAVFSSSNEPSCKRNDRDSGFIFELRFFRIKGQSLKHSKENFLDKAISLEVQGNIPRPSQGLNVPCPECESRTQLFCFPFSGWLEGVR